MNKVCCFNNSVQFSSSNINNYSVLNNQDTDLYDSDLISINSSSSPFPYQTEEVPCVVPEKSIYY